MTDDECTQAAAMHTAEGCGCGLDSLPGTYGTQCRCGDGVLVGPMPTGTVWCSRNCGWSVPYGDGAIDLIVAHLRSAHPETTEKGRRGLLAAIQRRWRGRFWAQSWWL